MDSTKQFTSTKIEHEAIIEDENHCCLCGTALQFEHKVDFLTLKVKEDASCPSCMIRMKSREHSLN